VRAVVSEPSASARYRANYDRAFPRRKAPGLRRTHSNGTPISFDYAKIAACQHSGHATVDHGSDEVCGGCGLIIACAPSLMEPQLKQISGVNFLAEIGGRRIRTRTADV